MTRVKFVPSSNSKSTELWSVNNKLTCKNSDLKCFKNINVEGEISIRLLNDLFGVNVYKKCDL